LDTLLGSNDNRRAVEFILGLVGLLTEIRVAKSNGADIAEQITLTHSKENAVPQSMRIKLSSAEVGLVDNVVRKALAPDVIGGKAIRGFRRMVCGRDGCLRVHLLIRQDACSQGAGAACAVTDGVSLVLRDDELLFYFPPDV
jgi:hypothetical protein